MSEGVSSAPPKAARARADRLVVLPLARATQGALALAVVLFVFGSSSVPGLERVGSPLRWVGLLVFAGLAVLWALAERAEVSRLLPVGLPTIALAVLGVVSAVWSIDPRLTVERGGTFLVALVGAGAVAAAVRGRPDRAALMAEAVVGATALVCVSGGILYAFAPAQAAQLPLPRTPLRFAGIGENPNTVQMIAALAAIPAAWLVVRSRGRRRLLTAAALAVLCAHVAASGSRGGLLALVAGGVCFAVSAPRLRQRIVLLGAAVAVSGAVLAGNQLMLVTIPPPSSVVVASAPHPAAPGTGVARPESYPVGVLPPFDVELGSTSLVNRSLMGGAGRGAALLEAFHQGNARPVAGFGFGTEEHAFFDRLEEFQSARSENSFLGLYLQLGALGPLLWAAVGLAVVWLAFVRGRRLEPDLRLAVGAFAGAAIAGYALGLGQSYVYSVGNVATLGFWIAAFLVAGLAVPSRRWPSSRRIVAVGVAAAVALVALAAIGRREGSHDTARQNAGIERIWRTVGGLNGSEADGFRVSPPYECVLYASGREPAAYELCFQAGKLVEAYDRLHGGFRVWSLRPFGPGAAAISVAAGDVEDRVLALYAHPAALPLGVGYLTRPIPGGRA